MGYPPCFPPPKFPNPVPNATLLSLFMFIRHGARVPIRKWENPNEKYEWHCGENYLNRNYRKPLVNNNYTLNFAYTKDKNYTFLPSCLPGMLLDTGVKQLQNLGKELNKYLVEETKLLPPKYDSNLVYLRSSFYPRCIESSVALLDGLYPPERDNETVNVTVNPPETEPLCPNPTWKGFLEKQDDFVKSKEFTKSIKEFDEKMSAIARYYNVSFNDDVEKLLVGDFINTHRCEKQPYPKQLADPYYDDRMRNMALFVQGFMEMIQPVGDKPIMEHLLNEIDKFYNGTAQNRFTLFSGHDITISTVLIFLGYNNLKYPPPFTSNILVELWKKDSKDYIRFVYNGNVLPFKGKDMILLNEFKNIVNAHYFNYTNEL